MQIRSENRSQTRNLQQTGAPEPAQNTQQEVKLKAKLNQADPNQTVQQGTAGDFVNSTMGERTGQSVVETRISQLDMNQDAYSKLDQAQQVLENLEAVFCTDLEEPDLQDFTKESQTFQDYVLAQATFKSNFDARGGSMAPMIYSGVAKDLVDRRCEAMQARVAGDTVYSGSAMGGDNQLEMNQKAGAAYDDADGKLQKLIGHMERKLEGPEIGEFAAANQAFTDYRDAFATTEANAFRGGSIAPMIWSGTAEGLTNERLGQLKEIGAEYFSS